MIALFYGYAEHAKDLVADQFTQAWQDMTHNDIITMLKLSLWSNLQNHSWELYQNV